MQIRTHHILSPILTMTVIIAVISTTYAKRQTADNTLLRVLSTPQNSINPIVSPFFRPGVFDNFFVQDFSTGAPICHLCQKVEKISSRVFQITLHSQLKFHDNTPLTSADIVFSYQVLSHPSVDAPYLKSRTHQIKKLKALSTKKLEVTFHNNSNDNLYQLIFPIIPKHHFSYFSDSPRHFNKDLQLTSSTIIGSGPYRLHRFTRDQEIRFRRNSQWWGFKQGLKNIYTFEKVHYKIILNKVTEFLYLKQGKIDLTELTPSQFQSLSKEKNNSIFIKKITTPQPQSLAFIGWNLKHPILKSTAVRKALSLLTPPSQKFTSVKSQVANSPWSVAPLTQSKEPASFTTKQRTALKILSQEGWKPSTRGETLYNKNLQKELKFSLYAPTGFHPRWLEAYQQNLKKSGIHIQIKFTHWNILEKWLEQKRFDAVFLARHISYPNNPIQRWHSRGKLNHWNLNSRKIDRLSEKITISPPQKRNSYMIKLKKELEKEQPITWLWVNNSCLIGYNKKLKGLQKPGANQCLNWPHWYK